MVSLGSVYTGEDRISAWALLLPVWAEYKSLLPNKISFFAKLAQYRSQMFTKAAQIS